jgi:MSHA biogenesis protein MshP
MSRGFALVPALFLLVIVAALAAVAIRVGLGEQQTATMALQQARTLAAANTGVEWGAYQALNGSCAASTTLNLTEAALNGFAVVVSCTATAFTNGTATSHSYVIASTATIGTYGQPSYVSRVVSATITDATS